MVDNRNEMNQNKLRELYNYDKSTGLLTNRITRSSRALEGAVVGSLNNHGYMRTSIDGKPYKVHRLIWTYVTGEELTKTDLIDHKDHDKANNKWDNLRKVTSAENSQNRSKSKNNTSGYTGVHWNKKIKKWTALVEVDTKRLTIGHYDDIFEAWCHRLDALDEHEFHKNHS